MKMTWERKHHIWDEEIILRTMLFGEIDEYRRLFREVGAEKLKEIFIKHGQQLDKRSCIFWGYLLGLSLQNKSSHHSFYGSPTRDITSISK